jgi:hypothetical protein
LKIGWTNTFVIKSYHALGMPKAYIPGKSTQWTKDLFIARFLYQNGTEGEIIKSYHKKDEVYHIEFNIKNLDVAIAKVYVTSCGFTMYYYDNTKF